MLSKDSENGNGRGLLVVNTVLTALILPLLGFVGVRLWDRVDSNARELTTLALELSIVKERQQRVLETLPRLFTADEKIGNMIEEHLRKNNIHVAPKPSQ